MTSTRHALQDVSLHIEESMGVRNIDTTPRFAPVPNAKDIGRLPSRKNGLVDIERVIPDPQQPRTDFDEAELKRLAESIKDKGQFHPIRVRWNTELEKWIIVMGERRWRATQLAGLSQISCYFVDDDLSQSEILEQQLIENLLRSDLKPLEEAKAYAALMEMNGWNGKQVAESLRISPSKVSRALSLLDLPQEIQNKIQVGELTPTAAYELSKLKNETVQQQIAISNKAGELTQKNVVRIVRQRKGKPQTTTKGVKLTFSTENGINVLVQSKRKQNYHEVREALQQAIEEVEHRIHNNTQLF